MRIAERAGTCAQRVVHLHDITAVSQRHQQ